MGVDDLVGSGSKEISLSTVSESERLSWIEKRFDVSILSSEKKEELKFGRPHCRQIHDRLGACNTLIPGTTRVTA